MLEALKYLSIVQSRGERGLPLNRVYRGMRSPELFLIAYMNLYGNAGAMTNGVDPKDHIDGMSLERIHNVIRTLKDGTFRWKPARRVYIPKTKGNHRPLGIPGWTDKLVQEVMRLVLGAYYEPRFSTHSHGFRPNRSCHTALGEIVRTWKGVKWLIEGDIKGCFDNINHELLISIISRDIHDTRFIQLLKDLLNVGYLENWKFHQTFSGTPQGGVVSPLLANIYLNEFDQHVEQTLIPQWTKGEAKKRKANPEYASLNARYHYLRKKGNLTEEEVQRMRELKKVRNTLSVYDPQDPKFRRLRYVRYADDFILGFIGSKAEAEVIKGTIRGYLRDHLRLEMSQEKTLITHASTERARFLGYHLHMPRVDTKRTNGRRSINYHPQLTVPPDVLKNWRRKYMRNGKPVHRPELLENSDYDIVMTYELKLRGAVNYYVMAHNVYRWNSVQWVMEQSLVKTLAAKHKTTVKKTYRKHGYKPPEGKRGIRVVLEREDKALLVATFGTKPIERVRFGYASFDDQLPRPFNANRSELAQRLVSDTCELCGQNGPLEVHHVRKLKDLKKHGKNPPQWVVRMVALRRKTLVVCHECHTTIHRGQYDGKRI